MAKRTPEQRKRDEEEAVKLHSLISGQWKQFSKTEAFKQFMDYIDLQDYLAIKGAKGPINTFEDKEGVEVNFDPIKSSNLLQRSVMCDIVKLYVDGYINLDTL